MSEFAAVEVRRALRRLISHKPALNPTLLGWYALGSCGLLLRWVLWEISLGTNDVPSWDRFAAEIQFFGLGGTYVRDVLFNHPPWMGLYAKAVRHAAPALGLSFGKCFKLLGLAAELATALLLRKIWLRRGQPLRAAQAFAAYGCGLCCILISGYHGNTDPAYWFLVLASAYLLVERAAPVAAGLALGAALNVKLIPLFVVLPMAATAKGLRAQLRFGIGVGIGLLVFVIPMRGFGEEQKSAFIRNVLGYTSYRENWGIELLARSLIEAFRLPAPLLAFRVENFAAAYALVGAKLLMVVTSLLALWRVCRPRMRLDAYGMAAVCFCLFLILASGFGVQYLGAVVPLLLALRIRDGAIYATVAGVFIGLIYSSFVRVLNPIYSHHSYFSGAFAPAAFAAWWLLVLYGLRIWRAGAKPRDPAADGGESAAPSPLGPDADGGKIAAQPPRTRLS
jgi:hypothetical protein